MAVLLAARGDEPDRGGQIPPRSPGQMYEPPLLAAVTLAAPPAGPGAGRLLAIRRSAAATGTFMRRTWTGYQNKAA